eukprot:GGOE01000474.1.p1 GENE.GGOE01000474.1~~GGOE01000474.1.p1  ORF type:complete len:829 (-),score=247.28 GGOE01000474.1:174-2351(-)
MAHYGTEGHTPLHEVYMCRILAQAMEMFTHLPQVTFISSLSGSHTKLVVVGDLHGQLADLYTIFLDHGLPNPKGTQYLFNGDFVDRGPHGVEVITILLAYKLLYPGSVHLNRGNHESEMINVDFGFFEEVYGKYPESLMFFIFTQLWTNLPIASVIDDSIFVVHGGLPSTKGALLRHLQALPKEEVDFFGTSNNDVLVRDCLWSDPGLQPGIRRGKRGPICLQFGADITRRFLEQNHLRMVIRSHEVPSTNEGHEWLHDDLLLTVFSASNYCGHQQNLGGVAVVSGGGQVVCADYFAATLSEVTADFREMLQAESLDLTPGLSGSLRMSSSFSRTPSLRPPAALADEKARDVVLRNLKTFIQRAAPGLTAYWADCEEVSPGHISRTDWVAGLSSVMRLNIHWATYEPSLLPQSTPTETVDWRKFLVRHTSTGRMQSWWARLRGDIYRRLVSKRLAWKEIVQLFDPSGTGAVTVQQLQQGLREGLGVEIEPPEAEDAFSFMCPAGPRLSVSSILESIAAEGRGDSHPPEVEEALMALEQYCKARRRTPIELFRMLDEEETGGLSPGDVQRILQWLSDVKPHFVAEELLPSVMKSLSDSGAKEGPISLMEFLRNSKPSPGRAAAQTQALVEQFASKLLTHGTSPQMLFVHWDVDGDGYLSFDEFQEALSALASTLEVPCTAQQIAAITRHVDTNGDERISRHEFLRAFQLMASPPQRLAFLGNVSKA